MGWCLVLKKEYRFYFDLAVCNFWWFFFYFFKLMQGDTCSCSLTDYAEAENNEGNSIVLGPCKMAIEVTICFVP